MSHTYHPDSKLHGLADDCLRCAEHAENPFASMDEQSLTLLLHRTLANRFGSEDGKGPFGPHLVARSETEAVAMASIMNVLERAGRMAEVAPNLLVIYLQNRWRASVVVGFPDA
jgi:hypothetical protein